jgi:beta-lactamase class A
MNRRQFLACSAIAPLFRGFVRPARAAVEFAFSGHLGVYAQYLDRDAPFIDYHGNRVFSSASVIKLLIAVGAMKRIARQGLTLGDRVVIPGSDIVGASDSFGSARAGSFATIHDLMAAMITESDNTAANALLDWCGEHELNELARQLGLEATRFQRHFMNFAARAAGHDNYTSAKDMVTLARGIALGTSRGYAGVRPSGCRFIYDQMLQQEDRSMIPSGIQRHVAIANKTGELVGVLHDVAIVGLGKSKAYAVALLSQDWSSRAATIAALRSIAEKVDRLAVTGM